MVSKARLDLPEPDRPVITMSLSRGISSEMFLRLCTRAPCTATVVRAVDRGAATPLEERFFFMGRSPCAVSLKEVHNLGVSAPGRPGQRRGPGQFGWVIGQVRFGTVLQKELDH